MHERENDFVRQTVITAILCHSLAKKEKKRKHFPLSVIISKASKT